VELSFLAIYLNLAAKLPFCQKKLQFVHKFIEYRVGPSYVIVITPNELEKHCFFQLKATFLAAK